LQRADCWAFNEQKYSKERFFIRKFFIKRDREQNLHHLQALVNIEQKPVFNQNEDNFFCKFFNF
jgi:hypothetical protein